MVMLRSSYILRKAVLGGSPKQLPSPSPPFNVLPKRNMASSSARQLDHEHEMKKWEKITYAGIATCMVLAIYYLANGHHHEFEEPQKPYPYLLIRNKDFPWGMSAFALIVPMNLHKISTKKNRSFYNFETIKKKHSHDK